MKSRLSRCTRLLREGVKSLSGFVAAKACRSRSYPFFGVPCGLTSGEGEDEGVKKTLYPLTYLSMHAPKTIEEVLLSSFKELLTIAGTPEAGILTLRNGIATSKGGNLSYQGKLVTTYLQPLDGKPPHQDELFRVSTKNFFPRIFQADRPVVTLTAGWQGAFYHWLIEVLPRLHLVEKEGGWREAYYYVDTSHSFQRESLELLNIPREHVISAKDYDGVRAPQVVVPSMPIVPTEWGCQFLRQQMLDKIPKKGALRLYVSRNDASRRRILNEEKILPLLHTYGFERVELSKLSFKEQAAYFKAAEVVVGPHGAGFSHLVFCSPGTPVLEIFSPAYVNPCYWHLCDRSHLSYHYFFGEKYRLSEQDPDIEVNLSKLEASLKLMGL